MELFYLWVISTWNVICRLYNGKAAEQELKSLQDQATSSFTFGKDLIKHNLVVFRNGESALQVIFIITNKGEVEQDV